MPTSQQVAVALTGAVKHLQAQDEDDAAVVAAEAVYDETLTKIENGVRSAMGV